MNGDRGWTYFSTLRLPTILITALLAIAFISPSVAQSIKQEGRAKDEGRANVEVTPMDEATRLLGQGIEQYRASDFQQALHSFEQASEIYRNTGNSSGEADALNNVGVAYISLSQYPAALDNLQRSLELKREFLGCETLECKGRRLSRASRAWRGLTLFNLSLVHRALGQYLEADQLEEQASGHLDVTSIGEISNTVDGMESRVRFASPGSIAIDGSIRAGTLLEISIPALTDDCKINAQAEAPIENRLVSAFRQFFGSGSTSYSRQGVAYEALIGAKAYESEGYCDQAIDSYQQALTVFREIGDRASEGLALSSVGKILAKQNQLELAIVFYKQSVNLYETIREELRPLSREQQQAYADTVAHTYRELADLLLQQDRVLEAQRVLDLLKVQELQNYLHQVRGTDSRGIAVLRPEQEILEKYEERQKTAIQL